MVLVFECAAQSVAPGADISEILFTIQRKLGFSVAGLDESEWCLFAGRGSAALVHDFDLMVAVAGVYGEQVAVSADDVGLHDEGAAA